MNKLFTLEQWNKNNEDWSNLFYGLRETAFDIYQKYKNAKRNAIISRLLYVSSVQRRLNDKDFNDFIKELDFLESNAPIRHKVFNLYIFDKHGFSRIN